MLLVTYFVLLLFFHSLILPLKAILMNLIGITASYGFLVMVFEWGILDDVMRFEHLGRLTMFPPVILFSILFGLSTDYEVFLLSRVKEIYERDKHKLDQQFGPNAVHDANYNHRLDEINEHSVAEGLERTAGIITAAGLIMIVVFGAFAMGHVLVVKELGVGLSMAVLLDSTIIRVILVPVSMKLMGHLNWWMPKALDWIPHIREGGDEEEEAHATGGVIRHGQPRFCGRCGAVLPERARFCGRCGRVLAAPRAPAFAHAGAGMGEGQMTSAIPMDMQDFGRQVGGAVGGDAGRCRAGCAGSRSCCASDEPSSAPGSTCVTAPSRRTRHLPNVPVISVEGLDVRPVAGQDPPEIQIRNARIRY